MNRSLWKFFTSLRLTVVCLAVGIVLIFLGTWAQKDEGLWNAQTRWFRSWFIFWGPVPVFPGGYLLGCTLVTNLIAAHIKRFTWSVKKIGIQLTHLGVILLLLGQLATDMLSRESIISLREGESKNYSEAHMGAELIFATDVGNGNEEIVSVPEAIVAGKGEITPPKLPFVLRVQEYQPNGDLLSSASLKQAEGRLATALATLEAEFSMPEGLVAQAERAKEAEGRVNVWTGAFEAVGERDVKDIVAAARKVAANHDQAVKLCAELKTRFRSQMLAKFRQVDPAMRLAAEQVAKNPSAAAEPPPPASTQGDGREVVAVPIPETNESDKRNIPYAVVDLVQSGQSLGTWLLSPLLGPQEITVGGKTYRAALRFERYYLKSGDHPYAIMLLKATHEVYQGTVTADEPEGIPKNFQSRVRIDNPQTSESREVDIYMNNPLRYGGLTFYQYQMGQEEMGAHANTSTLQVVRNPGWLTPYFGCGLVALGMAYQFLFHLLGFIRKRSAAANVSKSLPPRLPKPKRERAPVA